LKQIDVNLATHDFFDRRLLTVLMAAAAALSVLLTGVTIYRYVDCRKQLSEYSVKMERTRELISQKARQRLETEKKPGKEDIRRLSAKTAAINAIIARDTFPWNRLLDQLERKLPEGLSLESFSLSDRYDKLTMTGRADAAHKITFFVRRLEEWALIKNTIIQDLGLRPIAGADMADTKESEIGFTLECMISIEKLFDSRDPAQMGRILKQFSKPGDSH